MIIQSKNVWYKDEFIPAQIVINDGKITSILGYQEKDVDFDYGNNRIIPAFYDLHCHGYLGFDTNDANKEGLKNWLIEIKKEGVAGICPTTVTQSKEVLTNALRNVAEVKKENPKGAQILGIHFEGPYLCKEYKGAQNENYIIESSEQEMKEYIDASDNLIRIITLAPEIENNFNLIPFLAKHNINVSIGHSNATYEIAKKAIENGAKGFTHTFNAMSPFKHREVGVVGASLLIDEAYSEIICDGYHVNKEALELFFRVKPKDKIIMVSDALMAKGLKQGSKLDFGGQQITINEDGTCRLNDNTLAGSTLALNKGLKMLVEELHLEFEDAIKTCTINPMNYLGYKEKGLIEKGYDANITIIDDDYNVIDTYVLGEK